MSFNPPFLLFLKRTKKTIQRRRKNGLEVTKTSERVENRAEEQDESQEDVEETIELEEASGDDQVEDEDLPEEGKKTNNQVAGWQQPTLPMLSSYDHDRWLSLE